MKKLDFKFQHSQSSSQLESALGFKKYVECLNEAHNQMMFLVQDPRQMFPIMEENPLHSQDVLYGVPMTFKDILLDVVEHGGIKTEAVKNQNIMAESLDVSPLLPNAPKARISGSPGRKQFRNFAKRQDLTISLCEETMIEVKDIADDHDQTLVDLFKQPGFNNKQEHHKQIHPDLSFEGQLSAENHQET